MNKKKKRWYDRVEQEGFTREISGTMLVIVVPLLVWGGITVREAAEMYLMLVGGFTVLDVIRSVIAKKIRQSKGFGE
jgi:hypothetical protein